MGENEIHRLDVVSNNVSKIFRNSIELLILKIKLIDLLVISFFASSNGIYIRLCGIFKCEEIVTQRNLHRVRKHIKISYESNPIG